MNVQAELNRRFEKVVRELVKPPVLFGPKWLQAGPGKGQYQFAGAPRIAKATGRNVQRVTKAILRQLQVGDLGLTPKATPSGLITLSAAAPAPKPGAGRKSPADSPAAESA